MVKIPKPDVSAVLPTRFCERPRPGPAGAGMRIDGSLDGKTAGGRPGLAPVTGPAAVSHPQAPHRVGPGWTPKKNSLPMVAPEAPPRGIREHALRPWGAVGRKIRTPQGGHF